MDILIRAMIPALAAAALAGCSANGGFPGGDGGGGGGPGLTPGDDISELVCTNYVNGTVTKSESGGGCALAPILDPLTGLMGSEACSVTEEANAADADPSSFATVTITATGLDPLTDFGDSATQVWIDVALAGTVSPGGDTVAAFDMEIPGFNVELSVMENIVVSTFLAGEPTGESIDVASPANVGGALSTGRFLAGFVPEMAFDQLRISFGATGLSIDADDHAFVYNACTAAVEAPADPEA